MGQRELVRSWISLDGKSPGPPGGVDGEGASVRGGSQRAPRGFCTKQGSRSALSGRGQPGRGDSASGVQHCRRRPDAQMDAGDTPLRVAAREGPCRGGGRSLSLSERLRSRMPRTGQRLAHQHGGLGPWRTSAPGAEMKAAGKDAGESGDAGHPGPTAGLRFGTKGPAKASASKVRRPVRRVSDGFGGVYLITHSLSASSLPASTHLDTSQGCNETNVRIQISGKPPPQR